MSECEYCGLEPHEGHFCECGEEMEKDQCEDGEGLCPTCSWLIDK